MVDLRYGVSSSACRHSVWKSFVGRDDWGDSREPDAAVGQSDAADLDINHLLGSLLAQ